MEYSQILPDMELRKALKYNLHKVYLVQKNTKKVTQEVNFQKQLNHQLRSELMERNCGALQKLQF